MASTAVADKDLVSIQEARALAARAREAQKVLAGFAQEQVDRVVEACRRQWKLTAPVAPRTLRRA